MILIAVVAIPLALVALYVWVVLSWAYSDGERAGILQKLSRKGWLCKTYEGELAISIIPGVIPTIWHFSVRDERALAELNAALGKRVVLHYTEHVGVPSCFGDTNYFVNRVRVAEEGLLPLPGK
ncbi:MAG TPA: hypothetical protein VIE37_17975 [Methylomirabilota bacterium]|jgi:hypothetical protein